MKSIQHIGLLILVLIVLAFSGLIYINHLNAEQEKRADDLMLFCGTVDPPYYKDPAFAEGASLFKANCASCHNTNMVDKMTGPPLYGVTERRDSAWLYDFTRNSTAVIATGDSTAVALFEEYGSVMTSFPDLTDEEIAAIYVYVEWDKRW